MMHSLFLQQPIRWMFLVMTCFCLQAGWGENGASQFTIWYGKFFEEPELKIRIKYLQNAIASWNREDGEKKLGEAYANLASMYDALGKPKIAMEQVRIAESYLGNHIYILLSRGQIYLSMHQYPNAVRDLTAALQLTSSSGFDRQSSEASLCEAYARWGFYKEAISHCEELIKIANTMLARRVQASLALEEGKLEETEQELSTIFLSGDSGTTRIIEQAHLLTLRGKLRIKRGQFQEAVGILNSAINVLGNDNPIYLAEIYRLLGKVSVAAHEEASAKRFWSLALGLDPNSIETYSDRAEYRATLSQHQDALKDFRAIFRIMDLPRAHLPCARSYLALKQFGAAKRHLDKAIAYYPTSPEAYALRANVLEMMHKAGAAQSDYRVACGLGDRESCAKANAVKN